MWLLLALAVLHAHAVRLDIPGLGQVDGTADGRTAVFRGIPYAQPPVGELRWRPPRARGPWGPDRLNATVFGPRCMQQDPPFLHLGPMAEDCLTLNVATPAAALAPGAAGLPVMVWIHGGAFTSGSSRDYPLEELSAQGGVVVVTVQYRLNIFGFLGSAELAARDAAGRTGNYGLQDQRLAMEWVRDHIAAFGGDASRVTVLGQSAGGNSVLHHLVQPASFGLYSRAIVQSGLYIDGKPLATAERTYAAAAGSAWCSLRVWETNVTCLLHLSAEALLKVGGKVMPLPTSLRWREEQLWGPVIDGVDLLAAPTSLVAQGRHNKAVPVLLGSTRDEFSFFAFLFGMLPSVPVIMPNLWKPSMTEAQFDKLVALPLEDLAAVKHVYDPAAYHFPDDLGGYSRWWWTAVRVATDSVPGFGPCSVRSLARTLSSVGSTHVYSYTFAQPGNDTQAKDLPYLFGIGGKGIAVPHAAEIQYVFGGGPGLRPDEVLLARAVVEYWTAFARSGDPNVAGQPPWPRFDASRDETLRLAAAGISVEAGLRSKACDFWSASPPAREVFV